MPCAAGNPMLRLASRETPSALVMCAWEITACIQWEKKRADVCSTAFPCRSRSAQHAKCGTNRNCDAFY